MTFDPLPDKPSIVIANSLKKFFSSGLNTEEDSEFSKTIRWLLSEHDNLIKTTEDIYKSKFIDTAYGQSLDNIGYLVNCQRNPQEEDVFYRTRIKLAIAVRNSSGTKKDILNILSILTKIPIEEKKFNIIEQPDLGMAYPNAAFAIEMETAFDSEMFVKDLFGIINASKAASVYFGNFILTYDSESPNLMPPQTAGSFPYIIYSPNKIYIDLQPPIVPEHHTGYNIGPYNVALYSVDLIPYSQIYPYVSLISPHIDSNIYPLHPGYNNDGYNEHHYTIDPHPLHSTHIDKIYLHTPPTLATNTTMDTKIQYICKYPAIVAQHPILYPTQKGYNIGTYNEYDYALHSLPESEIIIIS